MLSFLRTEQQVTDVRRGSISLGCSLPLQDAWTVTATLQGNCLLRVRSPVPIPLSPENRGVWSPTPPDPVFFPPPGKAEPYKELRSLPNSSCAPGSTLQGHLKRVCDIRTDGKGARAGLGFDSGEQRRVRQYFRTRLIVLK